MVPKPQLTQEIKSIFSETLSISIDKIEYTSRLGKDLEMDSMDLLDVVAAIQDFYDITVQDHELEYMIFFSGVCDIVEYHLAKK
jgi:acyl carrier protein